MPVMLSATDTGALSDAAGLKQFKHARPCTCVDVVMLQWTWSESWFQHVICWLHMQGVIQHATINNLAFGRSVEETIRTLQAIQYVQENPDEVCPAGRPASAALLAHIACVAVACFLWARVHTIQE